MLYDYMFWFRFKSVPVREQGRTMQQVIQLISPISPKLSINVGYGELFTEAKHQLKIFYSLQVMAPFAKMAIFHSFMHI